MWTGICLCDLREPYRKQAEQKILQQIAKKGLKNTSLSAMLLPKR